MHLCNCLINAISSKLLLSLKLCLFRLLHTVFLSTHCQFHSIIAHPQIWNQPDFHFSHTSHSMRWLFPSSFLLSNPCQGYVHIYTIVMVSSLSLLVSLFLFILSQHNNLNNLQKINKNALLLFSKPSMLCHLTQYNQILTLVPKTLFSCASQTKIIS